MKRYFFTTGYGKLYIDSGSLHTALHRLGEQLENRPISWKVNGKYNFSIVLDKVGPVTLFDPNYH